MLPGSGQDVNVEHLILFLFLFCILITQAAMLTIICSEITDVGLHLKCLP